MGKQEKLTTRERVARHRAAMRARGYRLKQFWVPDMRTPEFKAEARRQSLLVANSPHEAEDQAWVDSLMIGTACRLTMPLFPARNELS
jgi:hypothetical protein